MSAATFLAGPLFLSTKVLSPKYLQHPANLDYNAILRYNTGHADKRPLAPQGPPVTPRLTVCLLLAAAPLRAEAVSFRNEVMAVLSKAGCNQGTCHGNQNGKGGFKLSLRGQDPAADLRVLTHDAYARRTNRLDPDQSLVLLKATLQVPHEGGLRFRADSPEYAILRGWIADGTPADQPATPAAGAAGRLAARAGAGRAGRSACNWRCRPTSPMARSATCARWPSTKRAIAWRASLTTAWSGASDAGETTIMVRYLNRQQSVRLAFVPARPDFVWQDPPEQNYIDRHVYAKLQDAADEPFRAVQRYGLSPPRVPRLAGHPADGGRGPRVRRRRRARRSGRG